MAGRFEINRQAVQQMAREIEREFAKHPVRVPLEAQPGATVPPAPATVNNYHGPVVTVTGDHAQIAWNKGRVSQTQENSETISPGFEVLAEIITTLLASLPTLPLDHEDANDVKTSSDEILRQVVTAEPDRGVIRKAVTIIKGLLAPIASGIGAAVTDESTELSRTFIESLGNSIA